MNYLITYGILLAVVMILARAEGKRLEREATAREAFQRAQDTIPQPPWTQQEADNDIDSMIYAIREEPREPYAAGRERLATPADQPDVPGLFLPAELDDLEQWRRELEVTD